MFAASWNPQDLSLFAAAQGLGASTAFWAFLGVECAAAAAGVVRDPVRNVPRATVLGVVGVMAIYIAVTIVMMGLLPHDRLAASNAPSPTRRTCAMGARRGHRDRGLHGAAGQGCLTGWTLVTSETTRTAADAGVFPALFRTRPGERVRSAVLLATGVADEPGGASLTASPNARPAVLDAGQRLGRCSASTPTCWRRCR